jgi:hypothetical protein
MGRTLAEFPRGDSATSTERVKEIETDERGGVLGLPNNIFLVAVDKDGLYWASDKNKQSVKKAYSTKIAARPRHK